MKIVETLGNTQFLALHKTAFLCSRRCPAAVVLKSYDWARAMRDSGRCVVSGSHSVIEKDVMHYLLNGKQPVILARARGMKHLLEPEFKKALEQEKLLIITPFPGSVRRITRETAEKRNDLMAELADEIFFAYAQPGGHVERLVMKWLKKKKRITTFHIPENARLIDAGVEIAYKDPGISPR